MWSHNKVLKELAAAVGVARLQVNKGARPKADRQFASSKLGRQRSGVTCTL